MKIKKTNQNKHKEYNRKSINVYLGNSNISAAPYGTEQNSWKSDVEEELQQYYSN